MSTLGKINGKSPKGNVLTVNTGSTTTKFALFADGGSILEHKIEHEAEELSHYAGVMEQDSMRTSAILDFLEERGVKLEDIDIVMCRGGMFAPCRTGVYAINDDMREVLLSCRDGVHASNLSALIGEKIAMRVNGVRQERGVAPRYGSCAAYVADAPTADEKLPECKLSGLPEFSRDSLFHVLNSRATVRRYLAETGLSAADTTVIVCHMGGGITVSLHRGGRAIDANDGLGGDGPITPERAGSCPAYQLVEMCFSGKYTKEEVKKKLVGKGGAVAYFGTNNMREVERKAAEGDPGYELFMKAFVLNIAKQIAAQATVVEGKVDAILLTGGIAHSRYITEGITRRVEFVAPVKVYPGENELESLAENGYMILEGDATIHTYNKDRIIED